MRISTLISDLMDIVDHSNRGLDTEIEISVEDGEPTVAIASISLEKPPIPNNDIATIFVE